MISVGIDVSKGKSTVSIMKPGGEILTKPFDVLHNIESLNALTHQLQSYDEEVRVVLEATGHYHFPVMTMLSEVMVNLTLRLSQAVTVGGLFDVLRNVFLSIFI